MSESKEREQLAAEILQPLQADPALLKLVTDKAQGLEIGRVVLVDDRLAPGTDIDLLWPRLMGPIEADPALLEVVTDIIEEYGTGNFRLTPASSVFDRVRVAIAASVSVEAKELLEAPANPEPELQLLESHLSAINLPVDKFWEVNDSVPTDRKLYFIDYRLRPNDAATAGVDASRLLGELLKPLLIRGTPPGAVLMSRNENGQLGGQDWEKVAEDGGFLRLNFRYVDKTRFRTRNEFLLVLLELLESMPLGRKYFEHMRSMRNAARKIVVQCAKDLAGLLPTDFVMFADRLTEGSAALRTRVSDHLHSLFTGLLIDGLKKDADVQASLSAFVDTLTGCNMMVPDGDTSRALNQLHSRLLYDRSNSVRNAPLAFGDIYHHKDSPDLLHLVITPECDLDPRLKKPETQEDVPTSLAANPAETAADDETNRKPQATTNAGEQRAVAAPAGSSTQQSDSNGTERSSQALVTSDVVQTSGLTDSTSNNSITDAPSSVSPPDVSRVAVPEGREAIPAQPLAMADVNTSSPQIILAPKVKFVLLVRGEFSDRLPDSKDSEISTRLAADPVTKKLRWIRWKLQEPAVMLASVLGGHNEDWVKWGRLREREAEKIQMRFATELLEVGTDDVSEHVVERPVMLSYYKNNEDHALLGDFAVQEIHELKDSKRQTFWAISAGSEELLCSLGDDIIPASVVARLRCYLSRTEVIAILAQNKIFVDETADTIYLIRHDRTKPRKGIRATPTTP